MSALRAELRAQADELDIAKASAGKLSRTEQQLAKCRQRLEEAADLRARVKEVEEQSAVRDKGRGGM